MKFRFCIVFVFFSFAMSLCVHAQDSYNSEPDSLQLNGSFLEHILELFEWNIGKTTISTFPSMGLDPASGLSVGVMQVITVPAKEGSKLPRPTSFVNHYTYSTNNWLNLKSDMILYTPSGYNINAYVQYIQAPDKFFGIGNDTINTFPVKFDVRDFEIRGDVSKSLTKRFFAGLVFDISHTYMLNMQTNEFGLRIPAQKNPWLFGVGPYIAYDTRNDINFPLRGEFISLQYLYYVPYQPESYTFNSFLFDAKKYITIPQQVILATQVFLGVNTGDMPFYNMFQLGGKSRMRGISNKYIYINSHAMYTQAELRRHIWGRFSGVAFAGIGNAFDSFSDMPFDNLKYVYGGGLRFQTSKTEKLHLRLDYGRSKFGDSGFYITMREAF